MAGGARRLLEELTALDDQIAEILRQTKEYHDSVKDTETKLGVTLASYDKLLKELTDAKRRLASLQEEREDAAGEDAGPDETFERCKELARHADATLEAVRMVRPATGSLFVRLFLGRVNVRATLKRDKECLRDEYNKFRYRTNWIFTLFPMVWALNEWYLKRFLKHTHWIHVVAHVWLLYYYVSLALRENILRVNGSKIKSWWIVHHYVSACMSVLVLTWPFTSLHESFVPHFTVFFAYQAVVQHVQVYYQDTRHYKRVALGKASTLDVKHGEGLHDYNTGCLLWVLVGFLVGAYGMQAALGYGLLTAAIRELDFARPISQFQEEIQVPALAMCFLALAIGNSITLASTLVSKMGRTERSASMTPSPSSSALNAESTDSPDGAARSEAEVVRRRHVAQAE